MRLHSRLASVLLAAALVTGCGGAMPEAAQAPVSVPVAPAAAAPKPDEPVSSTPAPAAGQTAAAPTPPAPPAKPVTTAPAAPGAGVPANPGTAAPTPPAPSAPPGAGATTPSNLGAAAPAPSPAPGAPADPAVTTPAPGQALSFATLQRGTYSGVSERKAVLISDDESWRTNWAQLSARQVPAPQAPAMDFSQHSVLAVYMGEKRSGGYAIEVTGVEVAGGKLKVTVRQTSPGPGAMVTQALTQPYHMVRIPKVPAGTTVEVNW